MEMTYTEAVAYPVIYAPDYGFGGHGDGHDHLWSDVYRIVQDWSDDRKDWNVGCVMGWVHKHELAMHPFDDEVENIALVLIYKSGVRVWVAGSDKLWQVANTEAHIELHGRPMGKDVNPDEDIAIHEYVLCEDCIRDLDDEVLEAVDQAQTSVRKRELEELSFKYAREKDARRAADPAFETDDEVLEAISRLHNGMPVEVVMTDAQLDAQLVKEQEVVIETLEGIAGEHVKYITRESEARQHARSLIDGELATPVVRQILEDVGTLMCMSGLDNVRDEVTERPILFTRDRHGRADHMQVYLEEIGKVVDVRVSEF